MRKRRPTTPGEILQEEFLKPLHLSREKLAQRISCDHKIIDDIVKERGKITPELAIQLAVTLKTTPDFWWNAQIAVDRWHEQTN